MRLVRVAVPVPALDALTYSLPDEFQVPAIGARVLVPLGNRVLTGCVIEFRDAGSGMRDAESSIRDVGSGMGDAESSVWDSRAGLWDPRSGTRAVAKEADSSRIPHPASRIP